MHLFISRGNDSEDDHEWNEKGYGYPPPDRPVPGDPKCRTLNKDKYPEKGEPAPAAHEQPLST